MKLLVALVLALLVCSMVNAGDIVTVPTANQLKAGEVDTAYYYLGLDMPDPAPQSLQAQTVYVGITDTLEIDIHRYDPEANKDETSTIINVSWLMKPETATTPAVVLGARNLFGERTTLNPTVDSDKASYYLSVAKNITPMLADGPQMPLIRLHASIGTSDYTLLGEKRHQGLFGGVQALLTPEIGAVALYDGQDLITGLTFTPGRKSLTLKAGTFGDHWWSGISYAKKF